MKPLSATEVLQVWEETYGEPVLEKCTLLLGKACSSSHPDQITQLSIGERDARLLQLREWTFGYTLKNQINCPNCNETIEWEADSRELHLQPLGQDFSERIFHFTIDDFDLHFRLPNSIDIAKVLSGGLNDMSERKILSDCLVKIHQNNRECSPADLPEEVFNALDERMAKEDPQADIRMNLTCPVCRAPAEVYFDIASYFWAEINNWSYRVFQEVYLLAKTFGWSEKDILNMSAHRRQLYINMIRA